MRVLLIQRWTRLDRGNSIAACTLVPCKEEVVENPWLARGFISSLRLDGTFGGHGIISADSHRKHTVYAILNIPCVGGGRQEVSSDFSSTSNLLFQYTCPRRFDNLEAPNYRRQGYAGGLVCTVADYAACTDVSRVGLRSQTSCSRVSRALGQQSLVVQFGDLGAYSEPPKSCSFR